MMRQQVFILALLSSLFLIYYLGYLTKLPQKLQGCTQDILEKLGNVLSIQKLQGCTQDILEKLGNVLSIQKLQGCTQDILEKLGNVLSIQNHAVEEGGMSMVRAVVLATSTLLLFIGVISFEPSRWFRKKTQRKKSCVHCLRCGRKGKGKEELKDDPPLVNGLQENEHLEMQKTEEKEEEVLEMKETIDFTIKQDSVNKEQAQEQQEEEKLREEEEKLQELKERLAQNKRNLIQREQSVQEKEEELKEKDVQLKLQKVLWLMEEEEPKKHEEEQQREKEEAEQGKINEQEWKKQEELRIRNEEECRHAKQKKYFQEEKVQFGIWETQPNTEHEQRMIAVEKIELDVKNRIKKGRQLKDVQKRTEQDLKQQGGVETLMMKTKDENLREKQLHIHKKCEELKDRERNLQTLEEENSRREGKQQEEREGCEMVWKTKELILLKREQEMRERKHNVEIKTQELLVRATKVKKLEMLDYQQIQEVLETTDEGLQQQQKHQDVHQVPPEPKLKGDDGVQRQDQDVHQVPPEPKLKGDDGVQRQHKDVHQVPPEPKLKRDDGVQQQHQDVHQVPPEPKLKGDDWVVQRKKQKHVHSLRKLNPHGGDRVQQQQQDVHRRPPEPKPLRRDEPAELENRKKNLMFRGLNESKNDMQLVAKLLSVMNLNIKPECTFRVGYHVGKRPVKVVFRSVSDRNLVLYNNNKVRNFNDPSQCSKNIFITPDYTVVEREEQAKLQDHLQEMREIDPNGQYTIKRGKVVKQGKGIHRW
uniref:golgin subfamily A member 6-like protein 7 isoform X2 n=1 Tax=Myxine glutinosa TaxID=7769 RepID=UPI00358EB9E1